MSQSEIEIIDDIQVVNTSLQSGEKGPMNKKHNHMERHRNSYLQINYSDFTSRSCSTTLNYPSHGLKTSKSNLH